MVGEEEAKEITDSKSLNEEYIKVKIALAKITEEKAAVSTISSRRIL